MRVRPLALRWHSILLPSRSFLLVPGKRSPDSSANRDWGSRAVPILQENFRLAWGIGASSSLAQTNGREGSMKPAILLVDVASTSREEWKSFLQSQKCDVETASDGKSAVKLSLQMQPDIVLVCDNLPDIASFELCRQIKNDPLNQLTPVVLLKSSLDQWDVHRGRTAGAIDIWATPASLWDALGRIETLVRLKKYMEEQAKSVVFSLAGSVDSKQHMRNGHSERLVAYAEQLGGSLGLGGQPLQERPIATSLHHLGTTAR